ncbi:TetR/AcrR family transcriptional regulator [Nocardiopsis sp. MG754419]|uniref:TetR/AcrR family transcriptional regulator n=1 Tax=Nocardiopsis sp. MG754419 TaxID=2259865 RepID=UPI001BA631C2|nr:TetR family transcriptional regulator [Nocardiopsis sp. MG754419]MBR8744611.1 TetR/AcrR family transcriptional regulator [Nocardiopsis sp. MG754419]
MSDTRERIIAAATAIVMERSQTRLSVRAVAARAGVGASTLRHHFPSQQALSQAVLDAIYDDRLPTESIRDTSVPARERLAECLRALLTPMGSREQVREFWRRMFRLLVDSEQAGTSRTSYEEMVVRARRRIEGWFEVLEDEGVVTRGARARRALLLIAVVDGLAIERALPSGGIDPEEESRVLYDAVDAALALE